MAAKRSRQQVYERQCNINALLLVFCWCTLSACAYIPPYLRSPHMVGNRQHTMRYSSYCNTLKRCRSDKVALRSSSITDDVQDGIYTKMEQIKAEFTSLSIESAQKLLVQKGFQFKEASIDNGSNTDTDKSKSDGSTLYLDFEKVPGCIANVHIRCCVARDDMILTKVEGSADALISRGLLAIIARTVAGCTSDEILRLKEDQVASQLGLNTILSPGRNDGVASIIHTIQEQLRHALYHRKSNNVKDVVGSTDTKIEKRPKVALLLSGGVDSSVALHLLLRQNYDVTAFYLKIWLEDELAYLGQCPWEDDVLMCQQVCQHAGNVPLETISLQKEYQQRVIQHTISEAEHGRTPNPDILCNSRVKFGCFYDAIAKRDFDYVATGHYAQLVRNNDNNKVQLLRAPDPVKDQTYFLCALSQEQLQRVLFPIGHLQKSEVRDLANEFDLLNRHRPDSQGLCFLGKVKFDDFLSAYLGDRPGPLIDAATGEIIGQHYGVWYHTVGQRRGLGKALHPLATSRGPWYVVAKNVERDIVYCSNNYDEDVFADSRSEFAVEDVSWVAGSVPTRLNKASSDDYNNRVVMKIRHGPRLSNGTLTLTSDTQGDVKLDKKDSGLAPGQYVVFYSDSGECLGGGIISEKHWAKFLLNQVDVEAVVK